MGVKYVDNFSFDRGAGFTGSATTGYARGGGVQHRARGGQAAAPGPAAAAGTQSPEPMISMPVSTASKLAQGAVALGARAAQLHGPTVGGALSAPPMRPNPAMTQPMPGTPPVGMAKGGHMNAAKRNALPKGDFAGPDRSYPINDESHARNALARASGKPVEARVRAAVHKKFPGIGQK